MVDPNSFIHLFLTYPAVVFQELSKIGTSKQMVGHIASRRWVILLSLIFILEQWPYVSGANNEQNRFLTLPIRRQTTPSLTSNAPGSSHNVSRHRRLENNVGSPQELVAMYQDTGEHYVDIWCGSPKPQRQTLLVVTGITPGASGFPCSNCVGDCGKRDHSDRKYQEAESKTFRTLGCSECLNGHCKTGGDKCEVGMRYPSGDSWRGFEVTDSCYLGGYHDEPIVLDKDWAGKDDIDPRHASAFSFDFVFACQTQLGGVFNTFIADGIMSMDSTSGSFWGQLYDAGRIPERKFTLCYKKVREFNSSGTHAGALTLGGADTRLHTSKMVKSELDGSGPNYQMKMRKVHLRSGGGESAKASNGAHRTTTLDVIKLKLNDHPMFLDSGYTNTVLAKDLMEAFEEAWKDMTGNTYTTYPKSMSEEERDALPTILFQLVGDEKYNSAIQSSNIAEVVGLAGGLDPDHPLDVVVAMPPSHYMTRGAGNRYMASIYESGENENGASVLGANFMRGHDVLFDLDDNRIGWAESTCDYSDLVEQYYDGAFGDIPWSKHSGTKKSTTGTRRGGSRRVFLFIILTGAAAFTYVQARKRNNSIRRAVYHDCPNELELRTSNDAEQEITFYQPPFSGNLHWETIEIS